MPADCPLLPRILFECILYGKRLGSIGSNSLLIVISSSYRLSFEEKGNRKKTGENRSREPVSSHLYYVFSCSISFTLLVFPRLFLITTKIKKRAQIHNNKLNYKTKRNWVKRIRWIRVYMLEGFSKSQQHRCTIWICKHTSIQSVKCYPHTAQKLLFLPVHHDFGMVFVFLSCVPDVSAYFFSRFYRSVGRLVGPSSFSNEFASTSYFPLGFLLFLMLGHYRWRAIVCHP